MYINLYTLKYISWLLSIPFVKLLNQYNPIVRSLIWVCFTRTFQQNESESAAKCTKQDFWKSFLALTNFISPKGSTFKFISASLAN